MPRNRITFIVIPPNDGQVQEFRFSSKLLWVIGLVCIVFLGALGYYGSGYYSHVDRSLQIAELSEQNERLDQGLKGARRELENLTARMDHLMEDDEKLRAWHEMPPLSDLDRQGGVGGEEEPPLDFYLLPPRKRAMLADIASRIVQLQYEMRLQEESFEVIAEKFKENEANIALLPSIIPVPKNKVRLTSGFGKRLDPFTGRPGLHLGVDFAGRVGTPVYATADGVVKYSYSEEDITSRLGNVIVIDHNFVGMDQIGEPFTKPGVYRTEYGHLQKRLVKKGDKVKRGQKIGFLGNTGRSTGPHLHYAIRYLNRRADHSNKGYVDPSEFLLDSQTEEQVPGWIDGGN